MTTLSAYQAVSGVVPEVVENLDIGLRGNLTYGPLGKGHINTTVIVRSNGRNYIVLQRVNEAIFKDPDVLMGNIAAVTEAQAEYLKTEGRKAGYVGLTDCIRLIQTKSGQYAYRDAEGGLWRAYHYIPGITKQSVTSPEEAYLAAKCFGLFHNTVASVDPNRLGPTIKDFHNGEFRYSQLSDAIAADIGSRAKDCQPEIELYMGMQRLLKIFEEAIREGRLKLGLAHNDNKLNNGLLNRQNRPVAVIDLETTMPGLIQFDWGDQFRTMSCRYDEREPNLGLIEVDHDYLRAITLAAFDTLGPKVTDMDLAYLTLSGPFMTTIIGSRFLADYLGANKNRDGVNQCDVYFGSDPNRPNRNREISANQIVLALGKILNIGVIEEVAQQKAQEHGRSFNSSIARGILSTVGLGDRHGIEQMIERIRQVRSV